LELYFVLDQHGEPIRERDLDAWSRWFAVVAAFNGVDDVPDPQSVPKLFECHPPQP
jgi:hypothetical protein